MRQACATLRPNLTPDAPDPDSDIELLLERVAQRVLARFDGDDEVEPDDDDLAVANAQAESLHIVGLTPLPAPEHDDRPLCAVRDGFTLHADRLIAPQDRAGLRRAIRYGCAHRCRSSASA